MKRYDLESDYGHCGMSESVDGEYVMYADHAEAMKRIAADHSEPARHMVTGAAAGAMTDEQILACIGEVRWSNNDAWCVDRVRALLEKARG